ncbi:MAG: flagellin [Sphingomonadales bacterium]|jgi:flagellar hook-associated protein 3 FlgL
MIPPLSTRAGHDAAVRRLQSLTSQTAEVQEAISTGKTLARPGDDPVAFARAATLHRALGGGEVQRRTIDAAATRLSASESAIKAIADIAVRAKELALAGRNAALNSSDRAAMAAEVRELLASARGLAEARDADGQALFAGAAAAPSYGDAADGLVAWAGLGGPPEIAIAGRRMATGLTGPEVFGETAPLPPADPNADPGAAAPPPPPRERNLFDSLAHLAASLEEPRPAIFDAGMDDAISAMDGHIDRLATAQARLGARAARLEAETSRLDASQLAIKTDLSRLEDTDMTDAIARLDRLSTILKAAQASFARVSRLSLWDEMR